MPQPFRMGGKLEQDIYTVITEYERLAIGSGYFGILFKNPHTKEWHMAQEDCGALIGTNKSKTALIKMVKVDVASGDVKIMHQQIKDGLKSLAAATYLNKEDWFSKFRKSKS